MITEQLLDQFLDYCDSTPSRANIWKKYATWQRRKNLSSLQKAELAEMISNRFDISVFDKQTRDY